VSPTVRNVIVVHAGNRPDPPGREPPRFPEAQVPAVTAAARLALATLRPSTVVSAPAAGADLIVLGEARALGFAVQVLVPLSLEEFRRASVADAGAHWEHRFEAVLDGARTPPSSVIEIGGRRADGWLEAANAALIELARTAGADGEAVTALTIRAPRAEGPESISDDFARRASGVGWLVMTIDPLDPGRGVTLG
jgi:hypothetical protein